ncbi:hypothetical protein TNCV_3392651 [Trichonephila clavipes]|nr:hypothetical protein TNCV_3392651 [Trichonephila clavipes]
MGADCLKIDSLISSDNYGKILTGQCGVMDLPTPSQRLNEKESGLDTAIKTVATVSMQIVAKKAKDVSGHSDIPVAIDGTWKSMGIRL